MSQVKKYTDWELSHCSNCGGELVPGFFGKHKDKPSCGDGRNYQQFDRAVEESIEMMFLTPSHNIPPKTARIGKETHLTPQDIQVLEFMEVHDGEITLSDALKLQPPVYRLSNRIRSLKANGYGIKTERVGKSGYGRYKIISYPRTEIQTKLFAP